MPKEYKINVSAQTEEQLGLIIDYISITLQSPDAASNVLNDILKKINSLSQMPNRIPLVDIEPWRSEGYHKMVAGNYVIYFLVDDEAAIVYVTSVVYGKREQKRQLKQIK